MLIKLATEGPDKLYQNIASRECDDPANPDYVEADEPPHLEIVYSVPASTTTTMPVSSSSSSSSTFIADTDNHDHVTTDNIQQHVITGADNYDNGAADNVQQHLVDHTDNHDNCRVPTARRFCQLFISYGKFFMVRRATIYAMVLAAALICSAVSNVEAAELKVGASWPGMPYLNIQAAIDAAATTGDEIWVEQGTYALTAMINVNKKVSIYGGFTGSETLRSQRNWVTNVTTVDGQNTVGCFNATADATIDGFTITRGYKNTGGGDDEKGGGIFNGDVLLSSPPADAPDLTVANCIFYRK